MPCTLFLSFFIISLSHNFEAFLRILDLPPVPPPPIFRPTSPFCRELLHGQEAGGRELGGGAGQVRGGGGDHPRPRRQVRTQDLNLSPCGPQYIKKSYRLSRCGFDR
jgi:hypothetical protein